MRQHPGPLGQPPEFHSRNCYSNFGPVGTAIPTGPRLFQPGKNPGRNKGRYDARKDIQQELLHELTSFTGGQPDA